MLLKSLSQQTYDILFAVFVAEKVKVSSSATISSRPDIGGLHRCFLVQFTGCNPLKKFLRIASIAKELSSVSVSSIPRRDCPTCSQFRVPEAEDIFLCFLRPQRFHPKEHPYRKIYQKTEKPSQISRRSSTKSYARKRAQLSLRKPSARQLDYL